MLKHLQNHSIFLSIFLIGTLFFGEYWDFYNQVNHWDDLMHGAFGGYLAYSISVFLGASMYADSPPHRLFHFAHAVGIAVMVGVLWEFLEYGADELFGMNMQKTGLQDTMADLFVDFGAAVGGVGLYLLVQQVKYVNKKTLTNRLQCRR